MRGLAAAALAGWLGLVAAQAQPVAAFVQGSAATSTYVGPGDIAGSSFTAWWGLRAFNNSNALATGNIGIFERSSDSTFCTGKANTAGNLDLTTSYCGGATLPSFCGASAGHCNATELFDQTGGGRPVLQATFSAAPTLVFNCLNTTLPCLQQTTSNSMQTSANFTPATGLVSLSAVANWSVGTGAVPLIEENGGNNYMQARGAVANAWAVIGGGASGTTATAADAAFHAGNGVVVVSGTSTLNIDGTDFTTTTPTGNTTAAVMRFLFGAASTTALETEAGVADNVSWSSTTRNAVHANQSAYWGTP